MLDSDLAALYAVSTGALIQAVKRNAGRFPPDFMFQLTEQELRDLRSQSVISKPRPGRGGRRSPPYAFSEQGVAMLSSVLRSERAITVNIAIMRAFVRLRELASSNAQLRRKLDDLERRVGGHDQAIQSIVRAIRDLAAPAPATKRRIGFV
jgi:ATP-dependent Clp protease ATP-binding subunit ClpA